MLTFTIVAALPLSVITSYAELESSKTIFSSGRIISPSPSQFIIKAANLPLSTITPGSSSYVSNWASILHSLGINSLRLYDGQLWHINMVQNPTTWATGLDSLLTHIANAGFKCYFYALSDPWGGELGINDASYPASYQPMEMNLAKSYIDKLAGNNSLNHNFITDPRILMWSVSNEVDFGNPSSPNSYYYWTVEMCDYIKSKGGKTTIPSPRLNNGYDLYTPQTTPMLTGHVDFLEMHMYGIWQLASYYSLGNNQYNWTSWEEWLKGVLSTAVNGRGPFDMDHVLLGEFGLWRGSGSDSGLTAYSFTDQNRVDYYAHYFNVINQLEIKNVCFHYAIENRDQLAYANYPRYGMIASVPYPPYSTDPEGMLYPGSEVIASNFGGTA